MANHVIIQTRDAIIARLVAGVSAVSSRVYKRDSEAVDASKCPHLVVEIGDFSSPAESGSLNGGDATTPRILQDTLVVFLVRCVVQQVQDADAEDAAFDLVTAVESTLMGTIAGKTLGGTIVDLHRLGGSPAQDSGGELETYSVVLQFQAWLRHLQGTPDSFTY